MMVGMAAGIYTHEWDLNNVVYSLFSNNMVVLVFCFIAIAFAQWSTNTAANLMPQAYILLNIFPKCKFWMTTIISGAVSYTHLKPPLENTTSGLYFFIIFRASA